MKIGRIQIQLLLLCILGNFAVLLTTVQAQQAEAPFVQGELIVQFRPGVTEAERRNVRGAFGTSVARRYDALRSERLSIPPNANPIALANALRARPEVEAAQPNFVRQKTSVASPNDPFYVGGQLWGLSKISAPVAWGSFGAGSTDVIVADIDTGVNYAHPDLAANMWRNPGEIAGNSVDDDGNGYIDDVYGIDSANNDSDPFDDEGHGTHTSGTIGAVSDNGTGVTAVAPRVKILACKFIRANGTGTDADAIECFNYVVALKQQRGVNVRVTNNSWGALRTQFFPQALKNAIDAAGAAGIVNVFAAGNNAVNIDNTPFDPASFTSASIVSVAASDTNDALANFSNYGAASVDLAAPGVNILSTYLNAYAYAAGTSMAAPHVAGAAAMLLSHQPTLTVAEVKAALMNGVDTLGMWSGLVATGGRLNLFQTLQGTSSGGGPVNVAAAAAGAVATASSSYSAEYAPGAAINGDRRGANWGAGGGWHDATENNFPDWVQVDFAGMKTIGQIDVFSVQDVFWSPDEPTPGMTFTQYGLRDFEVQFWNGGAWQTIPGATITGNNLVWRKFTFAPITTAHIRILVTHALESWSRLAEVEAWETDGATPVNAAPTVSLTSPTPGASFVAPASIALSASGSDADGTIASVTFYANGSAIGSDATSPYELNWTGVPAGSFTLTAVALDDDGASTTSASVNISVTANSGGAVNVAAAAAGAVVSASSFYGVEFGPAGAINGDRRGANWENGGGWNDATDNSFPDWLQVDFAGNQTISEIDVFSVQDAFWDPGEPTPAMTFTQYGLRDFEVQYWNGAAWQTIPEAVVTNNSQVWRQFTFAPITTSHIRIVVSRTVDGWSRIAEVEAY